LKYWENKCYRKPVGVCFLTDNFIVGLDTVTFPQSPKLSGETKVPSPLLFGMFIDFITEWTFCQRRKRKAEKVKVVSGACEEGILIFDESTKSIIMNHNVDERCPFGTREAFSCFLLLSHEWFMIQWKIMKENWSSISQFWKKLTWLNGWMAPPPFFRRIKFYKVRN